MSRKIIEKYQYLLSREKGVIFKDPGGRINIALAYPNKYFIGMSNLGFQGIYGLLNSYNDIVCERVFLPDDKDLQEFIRTDSELFTLESQRPLSRYDIIAFSTSFENDYPNILTMLKLAKIPIRSAERNGRFPLIIMGGVCAFYNPEPLAEFIDIFFTGEAEEMLPEFLNIYREVQNRDMLFKKAFQIEGIYIPSFYNVSYNENTGLISGRTHIDGAPAIIKKRIYRDISKTPLKHSITTTETEFSDMYLIEVMRGCPWSCRFCIAGHIYKPVRKKEIEDVKGEIQKAVIKTKRIGLVGPSLSDYPYAEDILKTEGVEFSITSLRASERSSRLVQVMQGHRSISIAPEAGTDRLRKVINKKITDNDILETAQLILNTDIEILKLYFMIGLPTETSADIDGIINICKKIRENTKKGYITLSISTFVPKPFTPFQWHPMEKLNVIKERLNMIKKGLTNLKGVRIFHDVPKYAYMQGLFAMGDRRAGMIIEQIASGEAFSLKEKINNFHTDFYIFRKKDFSEILPWDFIDVGIQKQRLWEEYMAALEG